MPRGQKLLQRVRTGTAENYRPSPRRRIGYPLALLASAALLPAPSQSTIVWECVCFSLIFFSLLSLGSRLPVCSAECHLGTPTRVVVLSLSLSVSLSRLSPLPLVVSHGRERERGVRPDSKSFSLCPS